jgi:hypothetical protein
MNGTDKIVLTTLAFRVYNNSLKKLHENHEKNRLWNRLDF